MNGRGYDSLSWRSRWEERYASGETPWDTQQTPPEVQSFWRSGRLPDAGLAFDLGCGPGTNVRFLAERGLTALGFDIALQPLLTAQKRLAERAPHCRRRAFFVLADVTQLPLHYAGACYILDVGCFHGVIPERRKLYVECVAHNLRSGGYYHLYAFDRTPAMLANPEGALFGVEKNEIAERFTPWMEIVEILRGQPDPYPCRWYLLRKR
ncbi:MAG: class I SAM-dependent methyltransferase [Caldilinea sp.]|nr:class I SAM-dependent methyltransferase [Caldilinea sp.]MDW8440830.1 class I SAM-dependent methyltransferase [Caldilineaceae bacterium]